MIMIFPLDKALPIKQNNFLLVRLTPLSRTQQFNYKDP